MNYIAIEANFLIKHSDRKYLSECLVKKILASIQFFIYLCFNILINKHVLYVINEKSNLNNGVMKQLYRGKQTVFRRNNKLCKIDLDLKVKKN
jgi:hypothetical protein